jgi:hypothetical protein
MISYSQKIKTVLMGIYLLLSPAAGCSHVVKVESPKAYSVTVSSVPQKDCEDLGEIYGKSSSFSQEKALIGAKNDLKNKAVTLGANYVLLETSNAARVEPGSEIIEILLGGRAMKCPETEIKSSCNSKFDCPGTQYCAPWGACASACKTDDDCAMGFTCTSMGECTTK